jgi:hypothetical protein
VNRKGPQYERDICRLLSEWWTKGERDDIFWRSAGSGARHTARRKKGKSTTNSGADVTFLDHIGRPLIETLTIEIKRGYQHTVQDLLDVPKGNVKQFEDWIKKVERTSHHTNTFAWLLIYRRDRREPLVWLPDRLWVELRYPNSIWVVRPFIQSYFRIRKKKYWIVGMRLETFLRLIFPKDIKRIWKEHNW